MFTGFEIPNHEALIVEQTTVQAEKFQGRLLAEYSGYIFPGQNWREPRGSAVVDFVRPIIGDAERATLDGVLEGLCEAKAGEPVNWVDMGGGRSLAMRQVATTLDVNSRLKMTNVDLFNFELDGLKEAEVEYLEELAPGMTKRGAEPALITDNVETVRLHEPPDVITSVEVMQYLNNPLEALANWYNQLADNGIMLVATEHDWASWIRYRRDSRSYDREETPTKHLLEELTRAEINCAVTDESDWQRGTRPDIDPNRFRIMAVQKKLGTSLRITQPVVEVWKNPHDYKATYYEVPSAKNSLVEVVNADTHASVGAIALHL